MDNITPPLRLWLIVLITVVVFVGGFFGIAYLEYPYPNMVPHAFAATMGDAIIKNDAIAPKKKSIVIFGSSLTHCAFPYISEMEKKISDTNSQVLILRIALVSLDMKKAESSNFFSYISEYPPNYLFLETNNLYVFHDYGDEVTGYAVDILCDDILRTLKAMVGVQTTVFNKPPTSATKFNTDKVVKTVYTKNDILNHHVLKFDDGKIAKDAFAELIKHKTKIVFVELPRRSRVEQISLTNDEKTKLQRLYDSYFKTYGIQTWKSPMIFNDSDFFDEVHLNVKGAKKYDDWFVSKFKKLK